MVNGRPTPDLSLRPTDFTAWEGPLWRIVRTSGDRVRPWWEPRTYGPLRTMRWDPQVPPPRDQPGRAVLYAASDLVGAVAEAWHATRRIDVHSGDPVIVSFMPEPLRLLDLTAQGRFLIRNRLDAGVVGGPRASCRRLASSVLAVDPAVEGLLVPSARTGVNVVLFAAGAAKAGRRATLIHRADDPTAVRLLSAIADELGYAI
ncbi:RES family NAD+ phosphorylase [Demequina rhizosphaerae]|uniref:RES family NAD+ phosphorylase n=1 Tax=Demequina rhizosphaerae TaxID=1638985 RepID=UPI000782AB60|nr:RES family NAD+ phosphorylase [Demequina rhizosphaerae]